MSCAKRLFGVFLPVLAITAVSFMMPTAALADISYSGDVTPSDSSEWSSMPCLIGHTAAGEVTVDAVNAPFVDTLYMGGYDDLSGVSGGTGTLTITGAGSQWMGANLNVGYSSGGVGLLNVLDGGMVNFYQLLDVGVNTGAAGTVTVDGAGSMLGSGWQQVKLGSKGQGQFDIQNGGAINIGGLSLGSEGQGICNVNGGTATISNITVGSTGQGQVNVLNSGLINASNLTITPSKGTVSFGVGGGTINTSNLSITTGSELTGTGTINSKGLTSNLNLTLDSTQKTLTLGNVDLNLDFSSRTGDLGIGQTTSASLLIQGATINTNYGYLGCNPGTSGTATVDGTNSTWNSSWLVLGRGDAGRLFVTNGGTVSTGRGYLGTNNFNTACGSGTAKIDGAGSTWTNDADMYIGSYNSDGSLEITNGGFFHNNAGVLGISNGSMNPNTYIGYTAGYVGSVSVDGSGSTFRSDANLYLGYNGTGRLNITNGGSVIVSGTTTAGFDSGAGAYINFSNGTLTTDMLFAKCQSTDLTGTGTIVTRGLVSDANITFDSTANHTFTVANNVTMNLNMSDSTNVYDLGVGYRRDTGTLTIRNGVTVYSKNGYIGYGEYRDGVATVEGSGSAWINSADLYVSRQGDGTLNIQNGASVSAAGATYVGSETGTGIVAFSGAGSVLSTKELVILPTKAQFTGAGTINARGIVSDVNLTFDNSAQTSMTLGTAVTLNLDLSNSADPGALGISVANSGSLLVQNGAKIYSSKVYLASVDGSSATATIDGAGSVWTVNGNLYLAGDESYAYPPTGGTGTLNISNGGMVSVRQITQTSTWEAGGPAGIINSDGGVIQAQAEMWGFLGVDHLYIKQGGLTIDTNGYTINSSQKFETDGVGSGGLTKIGEGKLTLCAPWGESNTYTGVTTVQGGTLELMNYNAIGDPSAWTPVLTAGGADVQNGKLVFAYDSWAGNNPSATVESLLAASYSGGSAPWTTGKFLCGTADSTHGLGWADDGMSQVTIMYTLYGDSNLDGSVNGTDLNAVLSYYNQSSQVWACGDFNYDGSVNGTDLNTVLSNYNQSLSSSTAAVPEPSTLLLVLAGLASLLAIRRVRARTHQ